MIRFHDRPFIEYLIEMLRDQGFRKILLLLGYRAEAFEAHFGDGSRFGVELTCSVTEPDDLTAHRLRVASELVDDTFLLLYCDNYWPMQFEAMWEAYRSSGAAAQMTVYANDDGYSRSNVRVGTDGTVEAFDRSRTAEGLSGVEIGFAILRKDVVLPLLPTEQMLFEEAVYPALVRDRRLHAFVTRHRYYSVGDHPRLASTDRFLAQRPSAIVELGSVLAEAASGPVGLDPEGARALRLLREMGPVVLVAPRATSTAPAGHAATAALADMLRMEGDVDAVYLCTHSEGQCDCPAGLLFAAQRDCDLDLTRTVYAGVDENAVAAARSAGCTVAPLGTPGSLLAAVEHGDLRGSQRMTA